MSLSILHDRNIISVGKKEQGLAWLVENGPVVSDPPLPAWLLKGLADEQRILRLRRGVYLAPTQDGHLPSLPRVLGELDEGGYITGYGALALHGLNDQEVRQWWVITPRRQSGLRYGVRQVRFVTSPTQARAAQTVDLTIEGAAVRVATPAQALVDELRYAPYGVDYAGLARVVRRAIDARRISSTDIADLLVKGRSVAVARRAGFLFDLINAPIDPRLRDLATSHRVPTDVGRFSSFEPTWKLGVPMPAAEIRRSAR